MRVKNLGLACLSAVSGVLVAALAWAGPYEQGGGRTVACTSAPQIVTNLGANSVSVFNSSNVLMFAQVNVSSGTVFSNNVIAGLAVPIPSNSVYTFDCQGRGQISKLYLMITNLSVTANAYVGWF